MTPLSLSQIQITEGVANSPTNFEQLRDMVSVSDPLVLARTRLTTSEALPAADRRTSTQTRERGGGKAGRARRHLTDFLHLSPSLSHHYV